MVLIYFLEFILAIIMTTMYFAGAWVPSAFAIGGFLIVWVISSFCGWIRHANS
ncbi:hypothetical protein KNT65_gp158 [Escherichia phage EcS1]|uniref:Uncharacterized protein n=1 Tax=Escherichia phage EcS1 TaxID=2083276 RepID=A0A2Z5ZD23_9CAUD|nr:hypothetical protein KNT65_gp158 [Escherichia phage EcS1]BBC78335.1 hypothetical protein [Escherichia phage EcS1]